MDELNRFIWELKRWEGRSYPELIALEGRPREAVPALCRALKDPNEWIRARAAEVLGSLGDPRAIRSLGAALRDEDWYVREQAVVALGRLAHHAAEPCLLGALGDDAEEPVRARAAEAFARLRQASRSRPGFLPDAVIVAALSAALRDPAPAVREASARALRECGSPAVPALCAALCGTDMAVRMHAAVGLGMLGDRRAVPLLCKSARSLEGGIAVRAAWALGAIGDRRAVGTLVEALRDTRTDLRCAAARALGAIAGREPAPELRAALPLLRTMLHAWRNEGDEAREAYFSALQQIEAVTQSMKDLPVPSAPAPPPVEELPLPAASDGPDGLPLPHPEPPEQATPAWTRLWDCLKPPREGE